MGLSTAEQAHFFEYTRKVLNRMKRILFVGNSFTYYNDLPAMFESVAKAAGLDIEARMVTKGGWYLNRFADPQDEMGQKLREAYAQEKWDYVVLQDQSFNPAKNSRDLVESAKIIREMMNCGEQMLMYQTWSYQAGSEKLAATGLTYKEMHDALKNAYQAAADAIGGVCVPVGDAFSECFRRHPEIGLYCADAFHPSPEGTYLAACSFYAAISGKSPMELVTPEGVDDKAAEDLRKIADDVWQATK